LIHTKVPILSSCGVQLSTHIHLVPRLKMSGAIPLLPLYAFMALTGKEFTIYLLLILNDSKYSPFLYGSENTNCGHDISLSHVGPQLLGGSQLADSEWPPDMVVNYK
jgi:hypothetical protein